MGWFLGSFWQFQLPKTTPPLSLIWLDRVRSIQLGHPTNSNNLQLYIYHPLSSAFYKILSTFHCINHFFFHFLILFYLQEHYSFKEPWKHFYRLCVLYRNKQNKMRNKPNMLWYHCRKTLDYHVEMPQDPKNSCLTI